MNNQLLEYIKILLRHNNPEIDILPLIYDLLRSQYDRNLGQQDDMRHDIPETTTFEVTPELISLYEKAQPALMTKVSASQE